MSDTPSESYRKKAHDEFHELIGTIAKANTAALAGCIAVIAQEIPITFPLGCFLLSALGYGLVKLSDIFLFYEVWAYYLNTEDDSLKKWDVPFCRNINIPKSDPKKIENFCMRLAFIFYTLGLILLVLFFLIGIISSFAIIALK